VVVTVLLAAACDPGTSGDAGKPATNKAGSGLEAKSADEILSAASAAFAGAKSVHMKGTFVDSGDSISLDLFLGAAGARGKIRAPFEPGKLVSLSVISTKRNFYIKSPQMWRAAGGAQMASMFGNRWVMIPTTNSADFKDFEQLTDLKQFANEVFKPDGVTTKGKTTVIDGTPAIGLDGSDGTLYIATSGTPYPIKIVPKKAKKPGEELAFLDYNAPLNLKPPANAVDLGKFGQ
jgi:hypothetical protein